MDHPLALATARKARDFAITAHNGQLYGGFPYVVHLDTVAGLLVQHGRPDLAAAGYLHDVPEDRPEFVEALFRTFPDQWPIVSAVTGEGPNRKARVASIYRKIKDFADAQTVKVADRLANGTHSFLTDAPQRRMYAGEADAFMAATPLAEPSLRNALRILHTHL